MTEVQAAATNRLRRKLEILKLDASKSRGQLFHDLEECQALMDIIAKGEKDQTPPRQHGPRKADLVQEAAERGFWLGRSCGGSKAEIDAALAAIREGGE
jgi:hypothetical protein